MKDVLPINRGRVVPKVFNKIGIDLEDTSWMDEPYYVVGPWHNWFERRMVYILNHEFSFWLATIMPILVFVL